VTGRVEDLLLPPTSAPVRADGLWEHSCFEIFVRLPGEAAYRELNFAPSGAWAAYRFESHRHGRQDEEIPAPRIATSAEKGGYELQASCLLDLPAQSPWEVNISAIIEETGGRKSYWALAHPPGKADFHDPACLVLQLPAVA
jgi:hypothetical protein